MNLQCAPMCASVAEGLPVHDRETLPHRPSQRPEEEFSRQRAMTLGELLSSPEHRSPPDSAGICSGS
jgi:hypothetical protein